MRWYHWIGLVALSIVLGIVWLLTAGRGPDPTKRIRKELEAIDAETAVKRLQTKVDTEWALNYVDYVYEAELVEMDAARKARAAELRRDPAKLAAYIVRGS